MTDQYYFPETPKEIKKAREFWIDDIFNVHLPYERTAYIHYDDTEKFRGNAIHVIEKIQDSVQVTREKIRMAFGAAMTTANNSHKELDSAICEALINALGFGDGE